ncbi:UDP-glucose--hexose-1-phosphate uridylyltransferase [Trifolium repens]|nr:UDP-glucose--hexose-1-phosphate uridylyltransferase [Trifolium repens]
MRTKSVGGGKRRCLNLAVSSPLSTITQENDDEDPSQQLRKSVIWNRWIIFSQDKGKKASDFKGKSTFNTNPSRNKPCVFCIGHEDECTPEIFRVPFDETNWKIRVVENPNAVLSRDLPEFADVPEFVNVLDGFGIHDIVIESPVHSDQLLDFSPKEIGEIFVAFTSRIQELVLLESIKYIQVFKNHGEKAGASMSHSHSHILALPIIPPSVSARLANMKDYFYQTGKCCICEIQSEELLIDSSTYFFSLVPFAASFPFEIWIVPRNHSAHFHELDAEMALDLGGLMRQMLRKMSFQLNNPPYNFMIHTSPLHGDGSELAYNHWFIQIVPQLIPTTGFELGTGCHINPVLPEDAAKVLREVVVPVFAHERRTVGFSPPSKIVDYSEAFTTKETFPSREYLLNWARAIGRENGFTVIIQRSDNGGSGKKKIGRKTTDILIVIVIIAVIIRIIPVIISTFQLLN